MDIASYDYYYGQESEQYSFFKIPRVLIEGERFKGLSLAAKFLYGVMLSRMELSQKSGWFDKYNRVYIYFSIDEVMKILGCGREKAVRHLAELDKDYSLIERKRQGQGKPSIIYVKHFARPAQPKPEPPKPSNSKENQDVGNENFQKYDNQTSESTENNTELLEVGKPDFQKYDNQTSKGTITEFPEVLKSNCIYIYESDTDSSQKEGDISTDLSEQQAQARSSDIESGDRVMDKIGRLQTEIKKQIEYDVLRLQYRQGELDEIIEIMTEIAMSTDGAVRIGNRTLNIEFVKKRYQSLDQFHIEYVMQSMAENKEQVRNIKAYLISALFNAPATIDHYYANQVNADYHSGG